MSWDYNFNSIFTLSQISFYLICAAKQFNRQNKTLHLLNLMAQLIGLRVYVSPQLHLVGNVFVIC